MHKKYQTSLTVLAIAWAVVGTASSASAAGFALIEQSASGMGNAFAGAAATAEDATTIFYNPAGMSLLSGPQFVVGGHAIDLSLKFSNSGSSRAAAGGAFPLGPTSGGNGGDAGGVAFVPNIYLTAPITDKLTVGLGVNAPFGLKTEYDSTWVGRYQGIETKVTTYNINPAVSYKLSDTLAIGAGVDYQQLKVKFTNAVATGLPGPASPDALANLDADDDTWGWNIGLIAQLSPATRIGISYRSQMKYSLQGTIDAAIPGVGPVLPSTNVSTDVTLPDMLSLSIVQKLNDKWDLLGDATFTRWSKIDTLTINSAGGPVDTLPFKFDDTWRLSLGANYHHSEHWTFKGGVAWDKSPVQDQYRTVRLPDNDRKWVSLGAKYQVTPKAAIDIGYSHLFISNASINNTKVDSNGLASTVLGSYEGSIDILSLQYSQAF
jgi:long-chain fatty acid transport protein